MPTMHELYGDNSDHEACPKCGMCKTCNDCFCVIERLKPHAADVLEVVRAMAGYEMHITCRFCFAWKPYPSQQIEHKFNCPVLKARELVEVMDGKG